MDDEIVHLFELSLPHPPAACNAYLNYGQIVKCLTTHLAVVVTGFLHEIEISFSDTNWLLVYFEKVEFI
jgi:hypothetical protein